MPTYEKCGESVNELTLSILQEYETHQHTIRAGVTIDFVFAYSDKDKETGLPLNDALKLHGVKALGICKKIGTKERALGRGDAEIALDGDWWLAASDAEKRALLDHELHHIEVKVDDRGYITDSLSRPKIKMRPHDYQFGWFNIIAHRHDIASQEQQQARQMFEGSGQYYWPEIAQAVKEIKRRAAAK